MDFILEKRAQQKLQLQKGEHQLRVVAKCLDEHGVGISLGKIREPLRQNGALVYRVKMRVNEPGQALNEAIESAAKVALEKGWKIISTEERQTGSNEPRPPFALPDLTDSTYRQFFAGVFEREHHIRIIHKSVASYNETEKEERNHVLLYGLPAGCKSTVYHCLKKFYEQDGVERVAILDATTLTKAGLEIWIVERARRGTLPEIICLEEVEKHQPNNLLCLLSLMASGYVMRTNAKVGNVTEETRCLIWATCNDEEQLREFHKGALWSRFTHQLHCARPSRSLMGKILKYKIKKIPNGRSEWVEPILNFAYDELQTDDPRQIVGLLDGRDGLLDGSYFQDLRAIRKSQDEEEKRRPNGTVERAFQVVKHYLGKDLRNGLEKLGLEKMSVD